MKPSIALAAHREAIRQVVESHHACNARVFGSVIHGSDTDDSDLDILVDPTPNTTLFDIGAMRHELLLLLGVPVDVLTPSLSDGTRVVRQVVDRGLCLASQSQQITLDRPPDEFQIDLEVGVGDRVAHLVRGGERKVRMRCRERRVVRRDV